MQQRKIFKIIVSYLFFVIALHSKITLYYEEWDIFLNLLQANIFLTVVKSNY